MNMNNLDEENLIDSDLFIKNYTPEETIIHFFNSCNIKCENINDINGIIIPRESLLDPILYDKIKPDIPKNKTCYEFQFIYSGSKNADLTQNGH